MDPNLKKAIEAIKVVRFNRLHLEDDVATSYLDDAIEFIETADQKMGGIYDEPIKIDIL